MFFVKRQGRGSNLQPLDYAAKHKTTQPRGLLAVAQI